LNCAGPPALFHRRAASFSRSPTSPCWPDRFTIIDNRGSDPVFGTFLGLPERAVFTNGTIAFEITYLGGDGNDVVLARLAPPRPPCPTPPLFIRRLTNNAVELSWPSCPSNFYRLAWTTNFQRWEPLTPPLAARNEATVEYRLRSDTSAEWLAELEAAARRPLETRFRYAFIQIYKPVLDDASFRAFDTTADYCSSKQG
jgi:hypothetical protein